MCRWLCACVCDIPAQCLMSARTQLRGYARQCRGQIKQHNHTLHASKQAHANAVHVYSPSHTTPNADSALVVLPFPYRTSCEGLSLPYSLCVQVLGGAEETSLHLKNVIISSGFHCLITHLLSSALDRGPQNTVCVQPVQITPG